MAAKIRKGDRVVVITGKDKGKEGEVLSVNPDEGRAKVSGVNLVTKHKKPSPMAEGSKKTEEAPIDLSNIALIDPKTGKATRVGFKVLEDGKKVRVAKKSGVVIDG
jgi:large subunit ribosomal protein L24